MNTADIIIILVLVLLLGAAILRIVRGRHGSCCDGGCGSCNGCDCRNSSKKRPHRPAKNVKSDQN